MSQCKDGKYPMTEAVAKRTLPYRSEAYECRCGAWHHRNITARNRNVKERRKQRDRGQDWTSTSKEWEVGLTTMAIAMQRAMRKE